MRESSQRFIQRMFSEYYRRCSPNITPPQSIEKREFGFLSIKERIMLRHKGFRNVDELTSFLKNMTPSDVYYSSAYYESPEKEMGEKGWLGADLVFDVDADHIPTPCGKVHDTWICAGCGFAGHGPSPEKCPSCGEMKFEDKTWPCEICLEATKVETMKLMKMLIDDFDFSPQELIVCFSGHRGYHVHVEAEAVRSLDAVARKEIVDYIVGIGLEPGFHGLGEIGGKGARIIAGPDLNDVSWRGRIAKGTYDFLLKATPRELEAIGLKKKAIEAIIQNKDSLLKSWKEKGPWGIIRGIGLESWKKIAQHGASLQAAKIDTVVTTDIHRLIRLTGTLHGKTGLKKIQVSVDGMEDFDPLKSAVAFTEGSIRIFVSEAPKFKLGDETFGPFNGERVELPTAAALFLTCKGAAEVVEQNV